jgi:hypothetical protein
MFPHTQYSTVAHSDELYTVQYMKKLVSYTVIVVYEIPSFWI